MTDAGFFKGTSADQDSRFSDKNKKLMKTMKFADNIDKKVNIDHTGSF
jgi:serine/arginine repetitive matrix protein 1